tara:strand:- start:647 stop:880 length:234 start_codon:yes stop_codon:yes gene_type:complete
LKRWRLSPPPALIVLVIKTNFPKEETMGKMKELYEDAKDNLAEEQDTFNLVILLRQRGSLWITNKLDELEQKMEGQE